MKTINSDLEFHKIHLIELHTSYIFKGVYNNTGHDEDKDNCCVNYTISTFHAFS